MPFDDDDDDALAIRKTLGEAIQEAWRITREQGYSNSVTVDGSVSETELRAVSKQIRAHYQRQRKGPHWEVKRLQ